MKLIRLQNMVPEVYPNNSRDFQLFCRLYDCVFNGNKFDIDSILDICDTEYIDSKLLRLLQSKLGFLTDADISDDELRYILKAFPYMVKWKGSKKAIEQAVYVFLKLNHIKTNVRVTVSNNTLAEGTYSVEIGMETAYRDTTILTEMLRYLMPTGYKISYLFYHLLSYKNGFIDDSVIGVKNAVKVSFVVNSMNSSVRRDFVWVEDEGYITTGTSFSGDERPWNTYVGESVTSVYNPDSQKSWHKEEDTNKWYAVGAVDTQAVYSKDARTTTDDTDVQGISPIVRVELEDNTNE